MFSTNIAEPAVYATENLILVQYFWTYLHKL